MDKYKKAVLDGLIDMDSDGDYKFVIQYTGWG